MSMPRGCLLLCLVSITITVFPASVPHAAEKPSYEALLKRLKQYDRTVDFGALRLAYAGMPEYSPYSGDGETREAMFTALRDSKFDEALGAAQKILDNNYVDIDAHTVCKIAYRQLGDEEKAGYHAFVAGGLIDSILSSGKVVARETAPVVISVNEEYVLLRALGLRPGKQQQIKEAGHSYDKLEVVDPGTGETLVLYFNVDLPLGWLDRQFHRQGEEKPAK